MTHKKQRKSRAKIGICQRCGGPKTGKGRKLCDTCRAMGCSTGGCGSPIHANDLCKVCSQRFWRAKDREENDIPVQFWYGIKFKYGLTREEYEQKKSDQGFLCFICKEEPKKWVVDHCHKTNKVRSLLCNGCNVVLGLIEKSPERCEKLFEYIKFHEEEN